jgi:hypothetical protein
LTNYSQQDKFLIGLSLEGEMEQNISYGIDGDYFRLKCVLQAKFNPGDILKINFTYVIKMLHSPPDSFSFKNFSEHDSLMQDMEFSKKEFKWGERLFVLEARSIFYSRKETSAIFPHLFLRVMDPSGENFWMDMPLSGDLFSVIRGER